MVVGFFNCSLTISDINNQNEPFLTYKPYFNKSVLSKGEPEASTAYLDIESLTFSEMKIWDIMSVYRDSKKNQIVPQIPLGWSKIYTHLFLYFIEWVPHNLRNLPPAFLAARYRQVSQLEPTPVLGKFSLQTFEVLQAKPAWAHSVSLLWRWLMGCLQFYWICRQNCR